MPELPEVQTIVDELNAAGLMKSRITGAYVFWSRSIAMPSAKLFCERIKGHKISSIWRRGKFLVFDFVDAEHLLIHLRMSGRIHLVSETSQRLKHEHVVLKFADGRQLRFHDTRKFGRMYLVKDPQKIIGKLGPEPLANTFEAKSFSESLKLRRRQLKPLLLDQTFIAGLGNIYVDEALWEARIHPCRIASTLTNSEIKALHSAIPRVLKRGLKNLGTSLGPGKANFYSVAGRKGRNRDELKVFRRTGLPCPRCKASIERIVVGQRATHICRKCQKFKQKERVH
jgi:formamidopyrimidine-DNA glycosylase